MSIVTIENYRGFDIEFETSSEKFQCIITEDNTKQSISFSAIKKFIDEYIKENNEFKPFKIIKHPNENWGREGIINVIGIRKDGRFVIQLEGGKKEQLPEYDESKYILFNEKAVQYIKEINSLKAHLDAYQKAQKANIDKIISEANFKFLKVYKAELIKE